MISLEEYERSLLKPLRQATLVLLLDSKRVLLAMKKRGFGVGKYNGVGGKPNPGEDIVAAAVREAREEIGVTPIDLSRVAELNFYFPLIPVDKKWNQTVIVFTSTQWDGTPIETEEMDPKWFDLDDIPYNQMWWDDEIWLPKVLAGKKVVASFMFGENEKLVEHSIRRVDDLDLL